VKTNHFSKQQCADTYEFSIVYKVYFLRLYSLSAKYVSVHIYVDSHIFGLLYITLHSKLYCSEVISIYIRHFERWPLLSMKRDSYYLIGRQRNAVVT